MATGCVPGMEGTTEEFREEVRRLLLEADPLTGGELGRCDGSLGMEEGDEVQGLGVKFKEGAQIVAESVLQPEVAHWRAVWERSLECVGLVAVSVDSLALVVQRLPVQK